MLVWFLLLFFSSSSHSAVVTSDLNQSKRPVLFDFIQQELTTHFDYAASPVQLAETQGYMKAIQRWAIQHTYGQLDTAFTEEEDRIVSISLQNPGMTLLLSQFFFEGDVLLTPPQARDIYYQLLDSDQKLKRRKRRTRQYEHSRQKRKIYARENTRWTTFPIPYTFHSSLDDKAKAKIREAIQMWEDNTCIRYKHVEDSTGDYVQFFKGQGCYSMIGRVGGRQGISIGEGCESRGVIAHEMGHSLGLWHEQSRPDRDCCININEQNIIKSTISNFLKRDARDIEYKGTKFDVGSDMHYGPTAFTTDWSKFTITTKLPGYQRTIGQRDKLSFYDIQIINKAYCEDKCSFSITCYWGGYQHPGDCSKCICPEGIGGTYCEKQETSLNAQCGGEFTVTGSWQEISSPGHPSPGYDTDQKCSWLLRAPIGKQVELEFIDRFQFWCTTTCMDYVEVKNNTDLRMTGMRFCCYEAPKEAIVSEGNTMVVIFRSTISRDVGFKARFKIYVVGKDATGSGSGWVPVKPQTTTTRDFPQTTTKATTTTIATTTEDPEDEGRWGKWSNWGACSESCGACGVKSRSRYCYRSPCTGLTRDYAQCAFDPCPTENSCVLLRRDQTCVATFLEYCYDTRYVRFKCTTHACCPPYVKYGNICSLGNPR